MIPLAWLILRPGVDLQHALRRCCSPSYASGGALFRVRRAGARLQRRSAAHRPDVQHGADADDFFRLHVLSVERAGKFPILQKVVLINPLVYASEGLRATLVPQFPHLSMLAVFVALVGI